MGFKSLRSHCFRPALFQRTPDLCPAVKTLTTILPPKDGGIVRRVRRSRGHGIAGLLLVMWSGCTSGGSADRSQASSTTSGPVGSELFTTATVPATSSTTSVTTSASTAPRACRGSDLQVTLGSSEGLGGTTYTPLIFDNRSSSPCALTSHPKVLFLDRSGRVIGQTAFTGESQMAVTLGPGEVASADIGVTSSSLGTCQRLIPATLRVVPPGGDAVSVATGDFAFCSGQNPGIGAFRSDSSR